MARPDTRSGAEGVSKAALRPGSLAAGGLPVGAQLAAAPWREASLLRAARAPERAGVAGSPSPPR